MVDPITLEVARNQFASIAEEMGTVLRAAAYSPNIKERADCSAAVFLANGEMLAQAEHIPVHLGSMPASVKAILDVFGTAMVPGTQYAVNDPFAGGTHLNDLTILCPVIHGSRLVAWVANRAHHADVGGDAPGSMPADAVRLTDEGHVVSPMVAVEDGSWNPAFLEPFIAATRTPQERMGDLSSQLGANEVGAKRLLELIEAEGISDFYKVTEALLGYGERRMRAAVGALPNGEFEFEDVMEWQGDLLPIRAQLRISGTDLAVDFSGTTDQVEGNINAVRAVTMSSVYYAVRVATDPSIPANGGCYRAIHLLTRPGSLVDAAGGVAVAAGNVETSQRIADVVLGALSQAAPDRVPAASQGTMNNVLIGNDNFAYYETIAGGQGARPGRNGQSGIHTGMTNTKNTPVESLERHYPFTVERYALRSGSGGSGKWDGGDGIERMLRFSEPATVSLMGERRLVGPWGLAGGSAGAVGEDWLLRAGDSEPEKLPGKITFEVAEGDRLIVKTPGGGGYG